MTKTLTQHFERFTYVNSDIKKGLFPLVDVPENIEYKVFKFGEGIQSEMAIMEMKDKGYEPATFSELLAWPDWNEEDIIVALGSVGEVHGDRRVPYLRARGSERRLGLDWWGFSWHSACRFLGVRNWSLKTSDPLNPALDPLDALTLGNFLVELDLLIKKYTK